MLEKPRTQNITACEKRKKKNVVFEIYNWGWCKKDKKIEIQVLTNKFSKRVPKKTKVTKVI